MTLQPTRIGWIPGLAYVSLVSWLGARAVNVLVAGTLEPPPTLSAETVAPHGPAPLDAGVAIDSGRLGRLFGIEPPRDTTNDPLAPHESKRTLATTDVPVCWDCEPVRTDRRLHLLFSLVATDARYSIAHLRDLDQNRVSAYAEGDRLCRWIPDATTRTDRCEPLPLVVLHILDADLTLAADGSRIETKPRRVVLLNEESHRLEFVDGAAGTALVAANGLPGLGVVDVPGDRQPSGASFVRPGEIVMRGENEAVVKRAAVSRWMNDPGTVASQGRVLPSFKNGVASGFRLFSLQPDSLYSALGVQNGDVVSRINGLDMTTPDNVLKAWSGLGGATKVEVTVERRGALVTKRFTIE